MPINQVILTITNGQLCGERHVFIERQPCLIGRAPDCDIQLSGDISFANISRHHCMLDIDPPAVRVRDLGSRNGTFLNGERIGDDGPYLEHEDRTSRSSDYVPLMDGDELRIGSTTLTVRIISAGDVREAKLEAVSHS